MDCQGLRLDRVGRGPADLSFQDQQGHRKGPEKSRGAKLRRPQEPPGIRRGDGLSAEDILFAKAQHPRRQGPQRHHRRDDRVYHRQKLRQYPQGRLPLPVHPGMGQNQFRRRLAAKPNPRDQGRRDRTHGKRTRRQRSYRRNIAVDRRISGGLRGPKDLGYRRAVPMGDEFLRCGALSRQTAAGNAGRDRRGRFRRRHRAGTKEGLLPDRRISQGRLCHQYLHPVGQQ